MEALIRTLTLYNLRGKLNTVLLEALPVTENKTIQPERGLISTMSTPQHCFPNFSTESSLAVSDSSTVLARCYLTLQFEWILLQGHKPFISLLDNFALPRNTPFRKSTTKSLAPIFMTRNWPMGFFNPPPFYFVPFQLMTFETFQPFLCQRKQVFQNFGQKVSFKTG